jgi:hypothetical protein
MDKIENWAEEWGDVLKGKFPWNFEDFCKVTNWYHELKEKPHDDWDLTEKGINLENDGEVRRYTINKFMPDNQLALYMMNEFGKDVFRKQFFRFMESNHFILRNRNRLEKDKMMVKGRSFDAVSNELIEALCVLPFNTTIGKGKKVRHTFDYREVIRKAKDLKNEEENANGGAEKK